MKRWCGCLAAGVLLAGCGERPEAPPRELLRLPPYVALSGTEIVAVAPGSLQRRNLGSGEDFALLPDGDVAVPSGAGNAITTLPRGGGLSRDLRLTCRVPGRRTACLDPAVGEVAATPDGKRFVFTRLLRRRGIEPPAELAVIDRDGGGYRSLVFQRSSSGGPADPDVSPDGRRVAYVTAEGLETVAIGGGQPRFLVSGVVFSPRFSPDGGRIAFAQEDAEGQMTVGVVATAGGPVADHGPGECPEWIPGGRALLVSDSARETVRLRPLSGAGAAPALSGVRCPRVAPG